MFRNTMNHAATSDTHPTRDADLELDRAIAAVEAARAVIAWVESHDDVLADPEQCSDAKPGVQAACDGEDAAHEALRALIAERSGGGPAIIYRGRLLLNARAVLNDDEDSLRHPIFMGDGPVPVLG